MYRVKTGEGLRIIDSDDEARIATSLDGSLRDCSTVRSATARR
jgi:hypothetical protein